MDDGKTYGTPRIRRGRKDTGRRKPPKLRISDPQTHRPRTQGRRTTRKRNRNKIGSDTLDGTAFAVCEDRNPQGLSHQDIGGREQGHRRINERSRVGRNQAIRAVIGLRADFARMLAIRRDVIAVAMFDRDDTDRRQ